MAKETPEMRIRSYVDKRRNSSATTSKERFVLDDLDYLLRENFRLWSILHHAGIDSDNTGKEN